LERERERERERGGGEMPWTRVICLLASSGMEALGNLARRCKYFSYIAVSYLVFIYLMYFTHVRAAVIDNGETGCRTR